MQGAAMKIQSTIIREQANEHTMIELLLAENPDAEVAGEFLKCRLLILCHQAPRVALLQLRALRRMRQITDEHIQVLQDLLRRTGEDIPQS